MPGNDLFCQPTCHLLSLVQDPILMEMIFAYLDVETISRLEQCCHLLRHLVVENRIYRRRVSAAIRGGRWNGGGWLRKTVDDPTDLEISNYFKAKLIESGQRWICVMLCRIFPILFCSNFTNFYKILRGLMGLDDFFLFLFRLPDPHFEKQFQVRRIWPLFHYLIFLLADLTLPLLLPEAMSTLWTESCYTL